MTEQPVTLQVLVSRFGDEHLIDNIVRQQTLQSVSRHRSLQENVANSSDAKITTNYQTTASKDIYGQDKLKLKTSEGSRYFQCENCGRKISGGRFASHINKCLERRGR
ncbi:SAGA-associated factor 11 [[Candida] railenensis]|uniref:SAGA-associated factor 11 n=1 Tax=[Candida] railenensis TaxID=45579 RepID=A0A9P0QUN5_9ASCO|nr:SAGA-associated factor 11 [[Candida] railenensis]